MVALFFATIGAWYLFFSPTFSFALAPREMWVLILFVGVGMVNITLLSALVASVLARDEQQQFLMRELQHRSLNLFSMIQAIASRSLVDGQPLSKAKELFTGRVAALARTHAMLEKSAWAGASLKEIILQELAAFPNQISARGCDFPINTPAAQHFALIVHELATNAVKYGALSCAEGRVQIEGRIEGFDENGQFRFMWRESGGPLVTPPTRQGFGSNVLFRAAKHFGQNADAKYAPEGLTYNLLSFSARALTFDNRGEDDARGASGAWPRRAAYARARRRGDRMACILRMLVAHFRPRFTRPRCRMDRTCS